MNLQMRTLYHRLVLRLERHSSMLLGQTQIQFSGMVGSQRGQRRSRARSQDQVLAVTFPPAPAIDAQCVALVFGSIVTAVRPEVPARAPERRRLSRPRVSRICGRGRSDD